MTGPFDPPPFRLEEYLGVREFSAQHHLTASDAQTLTVEELLAYAGPDERERFGRLPLSYAPTWGGEELRAAIADLFEALFAAHPDALEWEAPAGGCVCFPRYLGADGVGSFCRELVEREGVVLLPADIYASELGSVPTDRFRIGVGRRDPGPALVALGRFLDRASA